MHRIARPTCGYDSMNEAEIPWPKRIEGACSKLGICTAMFLSDLVQGQQKDVFLHPAHAALLEAQILR